MRKLAIALFVICATLSGHAQSSITTGTYPTVGAPCYVPGQTIVVQVGINVLAIFQCQGGVIVQTGGAPIGGGGNAATATNLAGGATGSVPYQSAASSTAFLAGNTAATDKVLVSHGTGSGAAAPTLTNAPALSAANMANIPSTLLNSAGDVLCAVAADSTILQTGTITGASVTGTGPYTVTYTVPTTSIEAYTYTQGAKIQIQGNNNTAFNVPGSAPLAIQTGSSAVTATTIAVTMASNPGTWTSGGTPTISLACSNQTTDNINVNSLTFATAYTFPANDFDVGGVAQVYPQFIWIPSGVGTSSGQGLNGFSIVLNGVSYGHLSGLMTPPAADVAPLGFPSTMAYSAGNGIISMTTAIAIAYPAAIQSYALPINPGLINIGVPANQAMTFSLPFRTTLNGGVASATYGSGGTLVGTGNVTLSSFNGSCSGTTATMAVAGGAGGAITITARGNSCASAPTTATCTSGTATCTGTVTLTGVLGGAPGNAIWMTGLKVNNY